MSPSRETEKKSPAQVVAVEVALPLRNAEGWRAGINGPDAMAHSLAAPEPALHHTSGSFPSESSGSAVLTGVNSSWVKENVLEYQTAPP